MKKLAGLAIMAISLFLVSYNSPTSSASVEAIAGAMKAGNVDRISPYLDSRVDISLPDKTDTYSKSQAEMIIRDFFSNNGVQNFQVKQKGENAGTEFCFGVLQTKNGNFKTCFFIHPKGDKQLLSEIRFQSIP